MITNTQTHTDSVKRERLQQLITSEDIQVQWQTTSTARLYCALFL